VTEGVHSGREHRGDLALDCDVVVVGSGAGGATVATELALAGQRVLVLEEGRNVPHEDQGQMRASESLRSHWREGAVTAALGVGGAPTVNVTMGTCVGGSSVVTGGVCFRVPEHIANKWATEMGMPELDAAGLDPFYSHVEKAIHVEEVPVSMRSRSTALFAEGCQKLGIPLQPIRRNTQGCEGCGRCNFGCPHGAKLSVDVSYLPRAIRAGAEVWSDVLVDRIDIAHGRAVGVRGRLKNGARGAVSGRLRVHARRVVVACGGIHTPVLMKASGLGGIGSQVGENLTLHPGFRVFARFDEVVRGWAGALQSAYTDHFHHESITPTGLWIPASMIAAQLPGVGPEHARLAEQVAHIAMFGCQLHDDGGGSIHRIPFMREPLVLYRSTAHDRRAMSAAIRRLGEIFLAAGARELFLPILGMHGLSPDAFRTIDLDAIPASRLETASQHPLGSCRMGSSAQNSAVNRWGESWDVRELYLADGSIIPSSLGVNPQLTIMAMATRIAAHLSETPLPSA
jgi:choline dehydrogenase-like flavoprotein